MPDRPDLDTLERLLGEYADAPELRHGEAWDRLSLAAVLALSSLLADARKVETLTKELADEHYEVGCLRAEVETLREALRFYAERRNYLPAAGGDSYDAMVARDSYDDGGPGARARAALEGASDE